MLINRCFNISNHIATIQLFKVWTWTWKFPSAKIAWNENILYLCAKLMVPNASNVMVSTRLSITDTLLGTTKQTLKLTLLDSKLSKGNYVLIASSTLITRAIIKLILLPAPSRNISLTENDTRKSIKSFVTMKESQFTHLWARWVYNIKKSLLIFTECSQEQNSH